MFMNATSLEIWCALLAIRLSKLTEVVAHRRQSHRIGKRSAIVSQRLSQVAPEFPPVLITHTQLQRDPRQRRQIIKEGSPSLRFETGLRNPSQAFKRAVVVFPRVVDRAQN